MKQRTTEQQWNELDSKGQLVLAKKFGDGIEKPEFYIDNECVYIGLTIGEMIEFLQEFSKNDANYIDSYFDHQIHWGGESGYDTSLSIGWSAYNELCDALWEAVKEVLNSPAVRLESEKALT